MNLSIPDSAIPSADWLWGGAVLVAGWMLKKWLDGRYERLKAEKTEGQKIEEIDTLAGKILATEKFKNAADHEAEATLRSDKFWDKVEEIVDRSKAVEEVLNRQIEHKMISQKTAFQIMITESVRGSFDTLQKSLGDSQALLLTEIREFRKEFGEKLETATERIESIDKDLQVHKAKEAK